MVRVPTASSPYTPALIGARTDTLLPCAPALCLLPTFVPDHRPCSLSRPFAFVSQPSFKATLQLEPHARLQARFMQPQGFREKSEIKNKFDFCEKNPLSDKKATSVIGALWHSWQRHSPVRPSTDAQSPPRRSGAVVVARATDRNANPLPTWLHTRNMRHGFGNPKSDLHLSCMHGPASTANVLYLLFLPRRPPPPPRPRPRAVPPSSPKTFPFLCGFSSTAGLDRARTLPEYPTVGSHSLSPSAVYTTTPAHTRNSYRHSPVLFVPMALLVSRDHARNSALIVPAVLSDSSLASYSHPQRSSIARARTPSPVQPAT